MGADPRAKDLVYAMWQQGDVALCVLDGDLRIVDCNSAFSELSGAAENVGKSLGEVFPTLASRAVPQARSVLATGQPIPHVELSDERPRRGEEVGRWIVSYWPLHEGEAVVGVGLRVHPAGARNLEGALRRNEAQFRAICDASPIGIFLTDENGVSLYSNRANLDQLGLTLEESRGDGWQRAIHPDDRATVREGFRAATLERRVYCGITRYLHANGRVVLADVKASGIYDGERLIGYVGMGEDITERARAEAALRESELRFRQLAENIRSAFWLRAADRSQMYYLSPVFAEIFGITTEEAMKRPDAFAQTVHPEDQARVRKHMAEPVVGPDEYEYRIVRPNGSVAWIHDRRFPVRDESGRVVRVAGIATDVTAQKNLEAQLLQANKLDSLGRLAGGVAHDFNNLLTVILNQGIMARRACEQEGRSPNEELALIHDAATQAAEVTRRLLAFARQQAFDPALLDPNHVTESVLRFLHRLLGERVELALSLEPDIGIFRGDRAQLEQALVNLALNARDAMPEGGKLSIRTRNVNIPATASHARVPSGAWVMIAVEDNGRGISESDLAHVFEPFFSTKPANEGTGLGLATCYGMVRQLGGHVLIESPMRQGTTVELYFPRADGVPEHAAAPDLPPAARGTETILVVEDEPNVRATAVRALAEHGYTVVEACDGRDALKVLECGHREIDLVLTDVVMPKLGGGELGAILRERFPTLRVLYTSGYPHGADLRGDDGAPLAFVAKPYVGSTLLRQVRAMLDRR
jgi:PAS domain S-box-containing protein